MSQVIDDAIERPMESLEAATVAVHAAMVAINPSATPFRLDAFDGLANIGKAFDQHGPKGARMAFELERAREASRVLDPTDKFTLLGKIGLMVTPWSAISGVIKSVDQFKKADAATREWARTGSAEARSEAIGTVAKLATTQLGVVLSSAETYVTGKKLFVSYKAAKAAFEAVAPGVDPRVSRSAAWAAAKHLLETGGRPTADVLKALRSRAAKYGFEPRMVDEALHGANPSSVNRAVRSAVTEKIVKSGSTLTEAMGVTSRAAGREALEAASRAAGQATIAAGMKAAVGTTARSLARFAPGVNVALAVLDTAQMHATMNDPKASDGKKLASLVTAAGVWVSATNVPLVSQCGALVSMVSAFVGALI